MEVETVEKLLVDEEGYLNAAVVEDMVEALKVNRSNVHLGDAVGVLNEACETLDILISQLEQAERDYMEAGRVRTHRVQAGDLIRQDFTWGYNARKEKDVTYMSVQTGPWKGESIDTPGDHDSFDKSRSDAVFRVAFAFKEELRRFLIQRVVADRIEPDGKSAREQITFQLGPLPGHLMVFPYVYLIERPQPVKVVQE